MASVIALYDLADWQHNTLILWPKNTSGSADFFWISNIAKPTQSPPTGPSAALSKSPATPLAMTVVCVARANAFP